MIQGLRLAVVFCGLHSVALAQNCPQDHLFFPGQELGRIRANRMNDLSGMAASRLNPGILWVHNGDGINRIFAIHQDGRPAGTFTLPRDVEDAEDIAVGPGSIPGREFLYLGDIGDPQKRRRNVTIVRAPEPRIAGSEDPKTLSLEEATYLSFTYPDAGHDAEALLLDPRSGDLFICTKGESKGLAFKATAAQLEGSQSPVLQLVAEIPMASITGGDISVDGLQIALRNADTALLWTRLASETVAEALTRIPATIPLDATEVKGEAFAFAEREEGYFTVGVGEDQPIFFFRADRTLYTGGQPLGVVALAALDEISGVAASRQNPGVLWMHNDGTNQNIFAVSTNGTLRTTLALSQIVSDFEDIAIGPGDGIGTWYLYAGDVGDNSLERDCIRVIRIPEPKLTVVETAIITLSDPMVYVLKYPDVPHNAETLLVDPLWGDLYVVTKEESQFRLYRASKADLAASRNITLSLVHTGSFALVSGGDISHDGRLVALRREDAAWLWRRAATESVGDALKRSGEEIPVIGPPKEPNGESVAFDPAGSGYFTFSEGQQQQLYLFSPLALPQMDNEPTRIENGWQLMLSGCRGERVALEISEDLRGWRRVGESTLTGGQTPFIHFETHVHLFYRLSSPRRSH